MFFSSLSLVRTAAEVCDEYGAMLACVTSQAEATYLGTVAANHGQDYWIGLTDVLSEGTFTMPCEFTNFTYPWCPNEPNNAGGGVGGADCVRIIGRSGAGNGGCPTGKWADHACGQQLDSANHPIGFICEMNFDKQESWWGDDDNDDDDDDDDGRAAGGGGGGGSGVAIFFAVMGCLGCAASIAANLVLWRRLKELRLGGRAIVGVTGTAAPPLSGASPASTYRAPLNEGAISSDGAA